MILQRDHQQNEILTTTTTKEEENLIKIYDWTCIKKNK